MHQQPKNNVEVVVARPNRMVARITSKGAPVRDMIYDGRTFTVVDGIDNFYSTSSHRGSLDDAAAQSLQGQLADAELWIGIDDSLPRRMKATRSNSGGKDLLVDIDFLTWDLNPQLSGSEFSFQPRAGAQKIPMVSLEEANAAR